MEKTKLNAKEVIFCPHCGKADHKWKDVYYRENAKLIRVESTLITWCSESGQHILHSAASGIFKKV